MVEPQQHNYDSHYYNFELSFRIFLKSRYILAYSQMFLCRAASDDDVCCIVVQLPSR